MCVCVVSFILNSSFENAIGYPSMYSKTLNNLATTYFRLSTHGIYTLFLCVIYALFVCMYIPVYIYVQIVQLVFWNYINRKITAADTFTHHWEKIGICLPVNNTDCLLRFWTVSRLMKNHATNFLSWENCRSGKFHFQGG